MLDTATNGLLGFMENCERLAGVIAESPEVRAVAVSRARPRRVAAAARDDARPRPRALPRRGPVHGLRHRRHARRRARHLGRVRARGRSAAAAGPARRGGDAPGPPHRRLGLPFRDAEGRVRVVVAAPIGVRPSLLGLLFDHRPFTAPLLAARAGQTGETYAFEGRAHDLEQPVPVHLRRAGLLGPDDEDSRAQGRYARPGRRPHHRANAAVRRRDQPLTRAAASRPPATRASRSRRIATTAGSPSWARGLAAGARLRRRHPRSTRPRRSRPLAALERVFGVLLALLARPTVGVPGVAAWLAGARACAPPAPSTSCAGFGEYLDRARAGRRPMGDVYLARHALLRRPTAVKLLRAQAARRRDRALRARGAGDGDAQPTRTPIAIYDYGRSHGRRASTTPWSSSRASTSSSLVAALRPAAEGARHPPPEPGLRLARRGARAGLVHRDIKPANCSSAGGAGSPTRQGARLRAGQGDDARA